MWERRAFSIDDEIPGPGGRLIVIARFLAEGGFSEVYEGRCRETGELCAVKALRLKHTSNEKTRERHKREAKTLYRLNHPHIVRVRHIGMRNDGLIYMVMDLLVGRNLRELQHDFSVTKRDEGADAPAHGKLPVVWVLEIMTYVCDALGAVHVQAKAIHRDLKPENVYVCDNGRVCLLDIGSAQFTEEERLTTHDVTIGTATYMSPEQLRSPGTMERQERPLQRRDRHVRAPQRHPPVRDQRGPRRRRHVARCADHLPAPHAPADGGEPPA